MPHIRVVVISILCSLLIFSIHMVMYHNITKPTSEIKEINQSTKYEVSLYSGGVLISRDTLDTFRAYDTYKNPKNGKRIYHNLNTIIKEL